MSEMVEKVARAIYAAQTGVAVPDELWALCKTSSDFMDNLLFSASAAIAAMREPTEAMVLQVCVHNAGGNVNSDIAVEIYHAFIDAALQEKTP